MAENKKIKVLYIAGWGRSGSTILDNVLGQLDGFFTAGELRYIWERGFRENRKCGCGQPFLECEIWQEIIQTGFGSINQTQSGLVENMANRYSRTMRILWLIVTRGGNRNSKDLDEYLKILEILYLGIARATKSRVIVDSSKFPVRAALLRLIPSIDLYIVHLVRDPRAVAHSWMTSKLTSDFEKPAYLPKINPVSSAIWWNGWNLVSEYVGGFLPDKYMRLNYEIFVSDPHASINEILRLLGETRSELPLKDEKTVVLKKNHTIAGNPVRFLQGEIVIQPDLRWLTDMRPYHKSIVTLITLPFLSRFGYSDRGSAHSCSKTPAS